MARLSVQILYEEVKRLQAPPKCVAIGSGTK